MAAITVRNLSDETRRALKSRAARHRRSMEAEVRAILDAAIAPDGRVQIGSLLASIGRDAGGVDIAIERGEAPDDALDLS